MKKNQAKFFIIPFLLLLSFEIFATDYYFYLQFTDKANSPYSLSNPSEYLSERATRRRQYFRITCDSTDLPVNPAYLQEIETNNFRIHNTTKWLNGATVVSSDSATIDLLQVLPFIKWIEYTGKLEKDGRERTIRKKSFVQTEALGSYGHAAAQINQVNGMHLHSAGYRGEGIYIGLLDAGFYNVDIMPAFNVLRLENRLLGTKDFVNPASNVFRENSHGASVLSVMASNIDGQYIGTAPDASYWLVRTENDGPEYPMEMDFWISGIEFLDSLGIDIVNSSLGYATFDAPEMNFTYADLNGETARISRAAQMASKKGIIVVNSAGNDGNKAQKYINVPADAKDILTVGAVTTEGVASNFSSFGPTSDGRLKPELTARGTSTALMNTNGSFSGNGTSFSAPIIAGMMACFLHFAKDNRSFISLDNLFQYVFKSANMYNFPTEQLGYGNPDFQKACELLTADISASNISGIFIFTDTISKTLRIDFGHTDFRYAYVQILDINGKLLLNQIITFEKMDINTNGFNQGIYAVRIVFPNGETSIQKILIQ